MIVRLRNWFSLPVFEDEEQNNAAMLLNVITLSCIVAIVVYAVLSILTLHSPQYVLPLLGILLVLCILSRILTRRGYLQAAGLLFLISVWCVITLTILVSGGITAPAHIVYLTVISMAALLLGIKWGVIFTFISILSGLVMVWLRTSGHLPDPMITYTTMEAMTVDIINAIMVLFVVLLSVRNLRSTLRQTKQELKERARIEKELQTSESRYRALVEQVPAVVYTAEFGRNGRWLYVSPQIERLLGFSTDEWTHDPEFWYKQLHPQDSERVIGDEISSRKSGQPLHSEYRLLSREGREVWFLDEASVITDSTGKPLFLQGLMYNITDRKSIEEKLIQSEKKYRQLADFLPQIVFEADVTGRIIFANQTAFDVFHYTWDDFELGLNAWQMIVPEQRQRAQESIQQALRGESGTDPEFIAITKDGRTFPVLVFSAPVLQGQDIVGIRGVIVDITDRKQIEEELRSSEERFRSAFDNAPVGMAIVGLDDQILQVNQALCSILGYPRELLLRKALAEVTHPDDRDVEKSHKGALLEKQNESFTLEKRYIHADGGIVWVQLSVSLVLGKDGKPLYYLGQLQDISVRKEAEITLRESERKYQSLYKDAERQTRELMLLHRVRNAMARELDIPSVIQTVVEAVSDTYGYALVSLYLLQGDVLHLQSQIGYNEGVIKQIPITRGICGQVVRTREPALITDVHANPVFLGAIENITSEVCVPLFDRGQVAGVLNVESTQGVRLTQADLDLMTALSEHVSLAIERARLYTEARSNEERFRSLIENSTDVISVLSVDGSIIYSSPSTQRVMGYSPEKFLGTDFFEKVHHDDQVWTRALFSTLIHSPGENIFAEFRLRHQDNSWRWIELTATNALNDPSIHGVIANYRDITDSRVSRDAIQTRAAQQSVLAQIGQVALVESDLSALMAQIVDLVAETFRVEFCKILELMPGGQSFLLRAGVGWKEGSVGKATVNNDSNSQSGYTLLSRTPVIVDDLRTDTRFKGPELLVEHGVVSGISVVIEGRDRPYGILGAHSIYRRDFSRDDVYFIQAIANVLAAAIGRSQADDALRNSEERYMLVATGANDGLWDWDLRLNEIYYSPRWKEMLGFAEDEIPNDIEEWLQRVHPIDAERVRHVVSPNLNPGTLRFEIEYRIRHKDESYRWVLNRGVIIRDSKGTAYRMAGSLTDITDRKEAEQQLQFDAFHDPLTGLSNRAYLNERLAHIIKYAERRSYYRFAVLFLDLDEFKVVNDRFGHSVGDRFLKEVARRLESHTRSMDTLARLGGDEFVILLEDIKGLQEAVQVAERVQAHLADVFDLSDVKVSTSASIGIVCNDYRYENPEDVLRDADIAMYSAKATGKAHYQVFSLTLREQTIRRLEREVDLRHALERRQFRILYQPIYSFSSRSPMGVEALLRWKHPTQGLIAPVDFIKIAEDSNLIIPIDCYVLREACLQIRQWEKSYPAVASWNIHVNLSSKHFVQPNLVSTIEKIIQGANFDPARVNLEITESAIMENIDVAMMTTRQLHDLGIQIGIDDFGTGYSSLNYLTRFPVDVLKLDRSFILRFMTDRNTREIIDTVVKLANKLGIKVIAEGVETEEQLSELRSLGCEIGQGYLFSKPIDKDAISRMVTDKP